MSEPERQFRLITGEGHQETWEPLLVLDDRAMGAVVFMSKRQESIYIATGSDGEDYERCRSNDLVDVPALSTSPRIMGSRDNYEAARRCALLHVATDHEGTEWALPSSDPPPDRVRSIRYNGPRRKETWEAMAEHSGVLADWYEDQGYELYAAALRFLAAPLQAPKPTVDVFSYTKDQLEA